MAKFKVIEISGREKLLRWLKQEAEHEKAKDRMFQQRYGKKEEKPVEHERVPFFPGECPDCLGRGYTTELIPNEKPWPTANKYVKKKIKCLKCGGTGIIKESTTAGSLGAAPANATPFQRYDAKGQPTSAVMPKRKKKKIVKRVQPKI